MLLILFIGIAFVGCESQNTKELEQVTSSWKENREIKRIKPSLGDKKVVESFKNRYNNKEDNYKIREVSFYQMIINDVEYSLCLFYGVEVRHFNLVLAIKGDKEIGYFDYDPNSGQGYGMYPN